MARSGSRRVRRAPKPASPAGRGPAARRDDPLAVATGPRVLLRPARRRDREEFCRLRRASRRFLAPWEPRVTDPTGAALFARVLAGRRDPANRRLLVCRREDGAILGAFSVSSIVRGVAQSATLGVWIGAAHARRGYMREALGLVLRHAFRDLRLHRVEANFLPSNAASRALARRAGFRREGYSPRYVKIAGRWRDHERWALLADEHRPSRSGRARGGRAARRH